MPLKTGSSDKAFKSNVRTEMHEGKPQNQSLAIAYAMKRKKKAKGGMMMAEGGQITDNYQSKRVGTLTHPDMADHEKDQYDPKSEPGRKHNSMAMHEDDRMLNQHGEHETGSRGEMDDNESQPDSMPGMHNDPHDEYQSTEHEEDMVGRIMAQRAMHYSEGGKVANLEHGKNDDDLADFAPNEFDDLGLRDDLEQHDTGANSGDELGDAQEDDDRRDIVSRVMKSRRLKDRLPNPR